ncbi:MAG: efflux RND transporter periplasmic adaptor subunit [Pseudomonadales bacterium]|nr:efflux RND transporter periplasmic adaptor subunit [Pseudomonadales bacterium]
MSKRNRWLVGIAVILIVLIAGSRFRQPDALPVPVAALERGAVEATVANTRAGTIKPCQRSGLSMSLGGRVQKLNVKKGDRVDAGQVLLELWNEDHKANVAQAEANASAAVHEQQRACLNAAQNVRENQRAQSVYAKQLIASTQAEAARTLAVTSQQSCRAAEDQAKMAQANLDLARARLDLTYLRAPYAGVIAEVDSELGEYATPSPSGVLTPPAVQIIDDSCLYVTAPIDEVDAMPVRVGQRVRITLDAFRGRSFDGQLTRIAPYVVEVEKQARTVDVDAKFDELPKDVALLVGYSADIEIILDERHDVLRVPSEAVFDKNKVYILQEDGKIQQRTFAPGLSNWTMTEAISGLQVGDKVVLSPDRAGLKEGVFAREETAEDRDKAAAAKKSP